MGRARADDVGANQRRSHVLAGLFLLFAVALRTLRSLQQRLDKTSPVREYIGIASALPQALAVLTAFLFVASLLPERIVSLWVLLWRVSVGWALRDIGASLIS